MRHASAFIELGDACVDLMELPGLNVAVAVAGSLLASFAGVHKWATALAGIIVAGAWISIQFQSHRARRHPSRATLYLGRSDVIAFYVRRKAVPFHFTSAPVFPFNGSRFSFA